MRKISNIAVAILFIISVVLLFKYSSLQNVLHIAWLEKPKQESGICVSLATSFVITAMFYFIMNYLPELIGNMER